MEGPFYLVTAPIREQPTFLLGLNVVYTSTLGFVQAVFRFVGGGWERIMLLSSAWTAT